MVRDAAKHQTGRDACSLKRACVAGTRDVGADWGLVESSPRIGMRTSAGAVHELDD